MFAPETFAAALFMTVLSTICWGSFANTQKLTRNYRFELYYWDYAAGIFLISVILAFTMGSMPKNESSFLANLHSAAPMNLFYAALGGFLFNLANFLLIAGIGMVGLAIAFPISIGIALVEGVVLSYLIQPKGSPGLLAFGVAMAVLAIILIGKAYGELGGKDKKVPRKGVVVCIISGLLMGTFAPFVTRAMTNEHPLTPYTIAVLFTLGALLCCFVFNIYMMKHPLVGGPVTFRDYLGASVYYHALGVLGGVIWGIGTVFNFVAAGFVGVAISYAIGQASPMVAALWGVFVWHEFRGASNRARIYLLGMFVCYLLALVLIARAYQSS
ncbi:MAG TPA: GRP family sugar transporter [Candidatus Acidoferrales bacterium]|nr:GRP family sugar transporter [Candidatus Acidoferrales bacterium]